MTEEEKGRRLTILQERQRAIQIRRNAGLVGRVEECLVEGFNQRHRAVDRAHVAESHAEFHARRAAPNGDAGRAVICPCG